MFAAAVHLLHIKDLKALIFFLSAFFYRHAGPNGPKEVCLSHIPGGAPQTKQCHLPRPYNLAHLENRVNPAHVLLLATTGLARDRPSPYGPREGFACSRTDQVGARLLSPLGPLGP